MMHQGSLEPAAIQFTLERLQDDTVCYSDTPTFISITGAHVLTIENYIFSIMAGLIVEILFMVFSVYNTV